MANQRKTGGRGELNALWTQINAIITDYTSGRTKLIAAIVDLAALRTPIAALVVDYAAGRAELVKSIADYAAGRAELVKSIADYAAGRAELVKAIADYAAGRAELVKLRADYTAGRAEVVKLVTDVAALLARVNCELLAQADIADATAAGKLKNTADACYRVAGQVYLAAAADPMWDLSAEVDTDATHYRAYWLYLDSAGAGSIVAGTDTEGSAALAIAALPAQASDKAVAGVYVAGPSTDFDGVAGLDAQGDIINGWPTALSATAVAPAALTSADPAAATAASPAAQTAASPAAQTAASPAAQTSTAPAALTATDPSAMTASSTTLVHA